jgi:hypothetical protein
LRRKNFASEVGAIRAKPVPPSGFVAANVPKPPAEGHFQPTPAPFAPARLRLDGHSLAGSDPDFGAAGRIGLFGPTYWPSGLKRNNPQP